VDDLKNRLYVETTQNRGYGSSQPVGSPKAKTGAQKETQIVDWNQWKLGGDDRSEARALVGKRKEWLLFPDSRNLLGEIFTGKELSGLAARDRGGGPRGRAGWPDRQKSRRGAWRAPSAALPNECPFPQSAPAIEKKTFEEPNIVIVISIYSSVSKSY
jgi:hypothetical protein